MQVAIGVRELTSGKVRALKNIKVDCVHLFVLFFTRAVTKDLIRSNLSEGAVPLT